MYLSANTVLDSTLQTLLMCNPYWTNMVKMSFNVNQVVDRWNTLFICIPF